MLEFGSPLAVAARFTLSADCNLLAVANGYTSYVVPENEVLLFPPGTTTYDALVCSVTAAKTLSCASGVGSFAVCLRESSTVFFEDGPMADCYDITFNLIYTP